MARYTGGYKVKRKFKKMNYVLLLSIIFSVLILVEVLTIDILPTKYEVLAIAAYVIINLIFFFLINVKNKVVRGIFLFFLVLFCDINIVGHYYVAKTFSFLRTSLGSSTKDGPTEAYNIYLSGHDFDNFRDLNMIITVNVSKHQILLTSIPRDYYIDVYGYDKKDKLSFIRQGINVSSASLETLFDTKIDYYVDINTSSVVKLVDTIGGIDYYSDDEYLTTHALIVDDYNDSHGEKLYVKKGWQHLNGIEVLTVSRERLKLPGGDRARQKNVQNIMIQIFKKMASPELLTKFDSTLDAVDGMYETTVPMNAVTELVKDTLANGFNWTFEQQSVDGSDTHAAVNMGNSYDWVMMPNEDTVNQAKEKIRKALE